MGDHDAIIMASLGGKELTVLWKYTHQILVDGRYKVDLETESDLTLILAHYFQFQYTFIPAIDPNSAKYQRTD